MSSFLRIALLLVIAMLARAEAQFGIGGGDQGKPALLADTTAIVPGKAFTVLVQLTMKPGWHVYWQFGGDSGAPPNITWNLPEGSSPGLIEWPITTSQLGDGDLMTFVYEQQVVLPLVIMPPMKIEAKDVMLKPKLACLVCEQVCIPGGGDVSLTRP